jgi:hypothetical protein
VAVADFDRDGRMDLYVIRMSRPNAGSWLSGKSGEVNDNQLWRNKGNWKFEDVTAATGTSGGLRSTFSALWLDANNDGWPDLYMAAGAMDFENVPQPNYLYLNDHRGGFIDVSGASGTNDPGQGRSVAVADFDGDGSLDMFVANYGQPPMLYRNLSHGAGNNWLRLELEGTRSNRDAVGARVVLHVRGAPAQTQEVQIGQGLGSSNDKALHFGLGSASTVDRIDIRWPSGRRQVLRHVEPNQSLHVLEPRA